MSDVPRSLQSWVSTIQTVVLTADVFQLFVKKNSENFVDQRVKKNNTPEKTCVENKKNLTQVTFRLKINNHNTKCERISKISARRQHPLFSASSCVCCCRLRNDEWGEIEKGAPQIHYGWHLRKWERGGVAVVRKPRLKKAVRRRQTGQQDTRPAT